MNLPFHKQYNTYTCGPACLQMVFEYYGIKRSQHDLAKALKTEENGTEHDAMISVPTHAGLFCYVNNNSSVEEIEHFLSLGIPIIVHFIEPTDEEAHYAVIKRIRTSFLFKRKKIILNDPWNGEDFKLSRKEFEKRWHDEKNIYKNWILALSDKDFQLGKQYVPKSR